MSTQPEAPAKTWRFEIRQKTLSVLKWPKQHWKISLFLLIILSLIGFYWWRTSNQNGQDLKFIKPEYKDLTKVLEVSGKIDAKQKARLRFAANSKVIYLGAQEGDWVNKWQTIATIDQRTLLKELQKDLNAYMKERWDWEETLDDTQDRWLDTTETRAKDQEQWDLDDTVLDVEIQDIAIKNSVATAPFAGILTYSPVTTTGVQLLATDYFEIIDPQSLTFRAEVDEADISLVKINQPTQLILDSYPNDEYSSHVSYISPTSSETSGGTVFVVESPILANDLSYYRLGMNGDARIIVDTRKNILAIPIETIREEDDRVLVDVRVDEKNYEPREISIGIETEDEVEVLSGLSPEDQILLPE